MTKSSKISPPPLKIGITGGIGSGKTTVCRIFEAMGIPVYYADERGKALMTEDSILRKSISDLFGEAAYLPDGSLNRPFIAARVFSDKAKLAGLNALVHPAVLADGELWHARQKKAPYTLKEAALLFESGSHELLDLIIMVYAPLDLRLARVMQRDGVTKEAVEARMKHQLPEAEKMRHSDFVIVNDGTRSLVEQVWEVHRRLVGKK